MNEQQTATPPDAGTPEQPVQNDQSFDDRLLAKFGLGETETTETPTEATPATQEQGQEEAEPVIVEDDAQIEQTPAAEFELKHNGEMKKVPMSEAQRLAQMGYDYEFKMQRVNQDAAAVKSVANAIQAREQMRAQTFDAMVEVKALEHQLAAYANVDWVQSAAQDHEGTFRLRMQHDKLVRDWQQASQKAQSLFQPMQQATQHIDAAQEALEAQKLTDRIPEWKDSTRRTKESGAILETMVKDYGFAKEEIGGPLLGDHRVVSILRDAYLYRQAKANQKAGKGQLQGLPKVATPGAKPAPRSQQQDLGDIKRGLAQVKTKQGRQALEDALIMRKFGLK